jgi:catechol 2,3-dioxygenase-like lactoylglutathione lyase family enzyme
VLFDHVDIRVQDLAAARPLFDALLPAMGFSKINADEESAGYHQPEEDGSQPFLWLVEDASHRPAATRIAFSAPSRAEVDRLAALAEHNGARVFEPAALVAEYGPKYYATFFEDASGNKYEICCRA